MTSILTFLLGLAMWHGLFWAAHLGLCAVTGLRLPSSHLRRPVFAAVSVVFAASLAATLGSL